jgi:hypothetical protein
LEAFDDGGDDVAEDSSEATAAAENGVPAEGAEEATTEA